MIWRPNHIRDITLIEQIQRRATKFILNDYSSNYSNRLKQLNLLPLMYIFELNEIFSILKSLKYPSPSFNITDYLSFADDNTRSSTGSKIIESSIMECPTPMDLSLSITTNKRKVYNFYGHIFYLTFNMITHAPFIFMPM